MSLGLIFCSLTVFYRDFRFLVPLLSQILLFLTPVIYPLSLVQNRTTRWIMSLNPMFGIVPAFRSAILGEAWDFECLAISAATALLSCTFAVLYFRRTEHYFVDFV
jgi:lipopolysaccharide transport system permease protein